MSWPNPGEPRPATAYLDLRDMPSREELMERYARTSGLDVKEMDFRFRSSAGATLHWADSAHAPCISPDAP
jgi:aminoglycoside phosphotransferase (APT) family kinase protein